MDLGNARTPSSRGMRDGLACQLNAPPPRSPALHTGIAEKMDMAIRKAGVCGRVIYMPCHHGTTSITRIKLRGTHNENPGAAKSRTSSDSICHPCHCRRDGQPGNVAG